MKIEIKCDGAEFKRFDELENFQGNLKTLSDIKYEKMKQEIIDRGFSYPFYVWNNKIFDGHQRQEVIKRMMSEGYIFPDEFPIVNIQAENEKELAEKLLAFNEQYGEITIEGLKDFIDEYDLDIDDINKYDLPDIDWEDFEIPDMTISDDAEDDAIPEVTEEPVSERGKVYKLGEHRLMCGDSTSEYDVSVLMNGNKTSLIITDPPYNVAVNDESEESLKKRNRRLDGLKIDNDKMSEKDFIIFLNKIFKLYYENIIDGGCIYVFYADSMTIPFMTQFIEVGFHFAQNCIWNKQQFVMTRKDYHYKHEPILYGWKKGTAHNWFTDRKQSSVWDFDRPFRNEIHPTMKPIELLEYPLNNSSQKNGIVLDLFLGSGSTLIACQKNNRICYGMELDEHYCDVIRKRWAEYVNGKDCNWQELTPEA